MNREHATYCDSPELRGATTIPLRIMYFHQLERIGHRDDAGNHERGDPYVGTGQVEGGEADLVAQGLLPYGQPGHGLSAAAAWGDVELLATANDLGRELLAMPGHDPDHEHFVESERIDCPETVRIIVDQGGAKGDDRVVHRAPVAPELDGGFVHVSGVAADLLGNPPPGPVTHGRAERANVQLLADPRCRRARCLRTPPPMLVPHQPGRSIEAGQFHEFDDRPILHVGKHATSSAPRSA